MMKIWWALKDFIFKYVTGTIGLEKTKIKYVTGTIDINLITYCSVSFCLIAC